MVRKQVRQPWGAASCRATRSGEQFADRLSSNFVATLPATWQSVALCKCPFNYTAYYCPEADS
jgi:hypothetical protein